MTWSTTTRGRRELAFVCAFVLVNLVVPLWKEELFPFSRVALFSERGDRYCEYTIVDAQGHALLPRSFGLGRDYFGLRGYERPTSIDRFGSVAPAALVISTVREHLGERLWVDVTQRVIGAVDAQTVGVIETHTWRVAR